MIILYVALSGLKVNYFLLYKYILEFLLIVNLDLTRFSTKIRAQKSEYY